MKTITKKGVAPLFLIVILGMALVLAGCGGADTLRLHSVTFMSHDDVEFDTWYVERNRTVDRPFADPNRDGWTFTDWFTLETGGGLFDFNAPITENTTVWARWAQTPKTVTFNLAGGNWNRANTKIVERGDPVTRPLTNPIRDGYIFGGWFNAAYGGVPWDFTAPVEEDVTVWAKWSVAVRVTFDLVGGSLAYHTHIYIPQGSTIAHIPAPTKSGVPTVQGLYRAPANGNWGTWPFEGWQFEGNIWRITDPVQENMNLVAQWAHGPMAIPDVLPFPFSTANFIHRAFYYMNENPGNYYLFLGEDITIPASPLRSTGINIPVVLGGTLMAGDILRNSSVTLVGLGEMRTITRGAATGVLFMATDTASITLGQNITLSGNPAAPANAGLLMVYGENASAYMLAGSKVTNHHQTAANLGFNAPVLVRGASFTMKGGEITGNTAAAVGSENTGGVRVTHGGTFNMENGRIFDNNIAGPATGSVFHVGGVFAQGVGTIFNMNGGEISGNTTVGGRSTGGVLVDLFAVFNLNGGRIHNNSAATGSVHGGVAVFDGSIFNMNSGQISNNMSNGAGTSAGGVFLNGLDGFPVLFNMNGGEISGNTVVGLASGGGLSIHTHASFNMRGGSIFGNEARGANSGGGIRTSAGTAVGTVAARIENGRIFGNETSIPEMLRNTTIFTGANPALGAALRSLNGNVHYGFWDAGGNWHSFGYFTHGSIAQATAGTHGAYNNTIYVRNGFLQDNL